MSKKKNNAAVYLGSSVQVTDKAHLANNLLGTVGYIGSIDKKKGVWYGIELNDKNRKVDATNGNFKGIQYFECDNYKAIFLEKKQIKLNEINGKKCNNKEYKIGEQVSVKTVLCNGIIKAILTHNVSNKSIIYYGIELENKLGDTDGKFNNIVYFKCKQKFGIFVTSNNMNKPYIEYDINELLVSGYININSEYQIYFSKSVLFLCIDFFINSKRLRNHIMFIYRARNQHYGYNYGDIKIKSIQINKDKKCLDKMIKEYDFTFDSDAIGCNLSHLSVNYNIHQNLENYIADEYSETVNSMILCRSWIHENRCKNTKMLLFDSNDVYNNNNNIINGFVTSNLIKIAKTSDYKRRSGDVEYSDLIYDSYNNYMIMCGGQLYGKYNIWYLDLNQLNGLNKIGWNIVDVPIHRPKYPCLEIIDKKKKQYFIYCRKQSYLITIKSDKKHEIKQLSSKIKNERITPFCCKYKIKNKIIVGGNCKSKQCEIYDIIKNKWILIKPQYNLIYKDDEYGNALDQGTIWIDDKYDKNIVFMSTNSIQTNKQEIVPMIEYIDLREKIKKWNILSFNNKPLYFATFFPQQSVISCFS